MESDVNLSRLYVNLRNISHKKIKIIYVKHYTQILSHTNIEKLKLQKASIFLVFISSN